MAIQDKQIGFALLIVGAVLFLNNLTGGDAGWFWIGAIAFGFLYAHRTRHEPGLAVPGGVLAGVALGALLESITPFEGIFLGGLAAGFYCITLLEPRIHAWALWPAAVLGAIAGIIVIVDNAWFFTIVLVAAGLYFLNRGGRTNKLQQPLHAHQTSSNAVAHASSDAVAHASTSSSEMCFDRLAAWRAQQATTEQRMPADIIANDQLERIAQERPKTLEALNLLLEADQVSRYGTMILEKTH